MEQISGFSKLNKSEKIKWLTEQLDNTELEQSIKSYWHQSYDEQKVFDEFSENTVSNFYFPYGLAPNFEIDGKMYTVPMVIEESSVAAAAEPSRFGGMCASHLTCLTSANLRHRRLER